MRETASGRKSKSSIVEEVIGAVRSKFNPQTDFVIVEGQLLWHIGVVGIVASRVLQEFYRPTIIIGGEGDEWRGSGRSIAGFDLAAALRECDDLLVRHGGHAMAAGLSIAPDKIDLFRAAAERTGAARSETGRFAAAVAAGCRSRPGRNESWNRLAELDQLKPTGQGNPAVQFCARNLTHQAPAPAHGRGQAARQNVGDGRRGHARSRLVEWRRRIAAGREIRSGLRAADQ